MLLCGLGTIAALSVIAALWLLPLDTSATKAGEQLGLRTSALALALALSEPEAESHRSAVQATTALLDQRFADLQVVARQSDTIRAAFDPAVAQWSAVRSIVVDPEQRSQAGAGLQRQAALLDKLSLAIEAEFAARKRQRDALMSLAALAAAATILWAALAMRRHRRHLRQMMRQFSADLGAGDWQDAVRSLRNERSGPPSAWDALASGVETVLGESDRRWQALADLAADWYWETDTRHRLAWMSGAAPPIADQGWSTQKVIGFRYDAIPFFEAPAGGWERFHARMEGHKAFRDVEFRIRARGGGAPIWVTISGRPRQDVSGRFSGFEGVGRDITERHLAHEQLRISEQRWSLMAGLASDFYWETDAEHRLLPLQPAFHRRLGELVDRCVGQTRWQAHAASLSEAQWDEHRSDLEARRPFRSLELEVDAGSERYLWLSISGIPRHDVAGNFVGYHGVGKDVTMRKQAERLLLRHNEELQRAVAVRTRELELVNLDLDAFARQLAHELRTPIGQFQGLAHLLEARAADRLIDEDRALIELQIQASKHMRDTVDALLLLARSTMQPMDLEPVDLSALAREVIAELPELKRVALVDWQVQDGMRAQASPAAMRIVLTNLLGNAAKFTRQLADPIVRITCRELPDQQVQISVRDNGAGFDMAQADRLFKPFNRLHSDADFQGTGIGLSIVQRIVERHGGRVSARGEVGLGASFEVVLSAAPAPLAART